MTKIVKLTAENFKRLVAVEIEPTGRIVPITGRNGEGKTSVLDAITAALVGQKDFKIDQPIRQGEEEPSSRSTWASSSPLDAGEGTRASWRSGSPVAPRCPRLAASSTT